MNNQKQLIVIGGSAGCLTDVISIIKGLTEKFSIPIVLVIHRQRNVISELSKILNAIHDKQIVEPDDKDPVNACCIYLAPQNYHLLFEHDETFSLDYSEMVRYSRPSIDVTFESAAMVYGQGTTGIVLSGANNDGASGLQTILTHGGTAIVQHPGEAEYKAMPNAAIEMNPAARVMKTKEIVAYLNSL